MEKKKFNFKKFGLVLCVCFITLFAFIPFANFNNIGSVSAATITDTNYNNSSDVDYFWSAVDISYAYTFSSADYIWFDGSNIYYSNGQYVLDRSTSTWSSKTWSGLSSLNGTCVWTDGKDIYYSNNSTQYVLDKSTSTWYEKAWNGLSSFLGSNTSSFLIASVLFF